MRHFIRDESGDAVVEATILFPIIIMIFTALSLLAVYLPQRTQLQQAVQHAAVVAASMQSDTGYRFSTSTMQATFEPPAGISGNAQRNVYTNLFNNLDSNEEATTEKVVRNWMAKGFVKRNSVIDIEVAMENFVVYKRVTVTATETITMPVSLSFIGFPEQIPLTASASCVVQNADEFTRNLDIAVDLLTFLDEKLGASDFIFEKVREVKQYFSF